MTLRKNKRTVKEDSFNTPAISRGGMMNVAGASDNDIDPDEELLADDIVQPDESNDNGPVGAPFYPEGKVFLKLGDLKRLVSETILSSTRYNFD